MMLLALLLGVVAGLRTFTPLAAVSWAARLGILKLDGTWASFLGYLWTPWIFSVLALAELVNDKLPRTPSRKTPPQFAARIVSGTFAGLTLGFGHEAVVICAVLGAIGAVLGTLGGAAARSGLTKAIGGKDLPIALLEDCVAVGAAVLIVFSIR
ncbi:MAG TPA: DUF4126 family protein [Acidobacteriaceae bacterium]|nr:DUF4126 family protein [Acidobacteriaceae bacterium]